MSPSPHDQPPAGKGDPAGPPVDANRSAKRGGAITLAAQVLQIVLGIGGGATLARLLDPSDFGLYAAAVVALVPITTLREFGLSAAIARAPSISPAQMTGLFWLGMRYGGYLAIALLGLAPIAAWFYNEPWLLRALPAMAAAVFVQSIGAVPIGLLRRQMRFGFLVIAEVSANVAAISVAILLAVAGAGAWALIGQSITQLVSVAVIASIFAAGVGGWRAGWRVSASSREELRDFVRFGWQATTSRVVLNVGRYYDYAVLGRFAGSAPLGLYERANQWANFPARQVMAPLVYVAVSGLSDAYRRFEANPDDPEPLRLYRKKSRTAIGLLLAAVYPALFGLMVEAPTAVRVLLGEKWLEASPLLVLLAAAGVFVALGRTTKWIYLAEGRTGQQLTWSFVETGLIVVGVTAGLIVGDATPEGVAWGFLAGTGIGGLGSVANCLRGGALRGRDAWQPAAAAALAATIAAAVCLVAGSILPLPEGTQTMAGALKRGIIEGTLFLSAYAAATLATPWGRGLIRSVLPGQSA